MPESVYPGKGKVPVANSPCGHDVDPLLHKRAERALTPDEARTLDLQLSACATCRERASLLEWAGDRLRTDRRPPPPGLAERVMRRLDERGPALPVRAGSAPTPVWRPASRWVGATALAVAALALAVGGFLVARHNTRPTVVATRSVPVELSLVSETARSVGVAGDFNGWDAAAMKRGADGVWRVRLSLPPGRYQYAFLVDERRWVADVHAATLLDSGYGGLDSVLDLPL